MYTLTHNGNVLFDPRLDGYPIQKPKLVQEANKIGYVEFTILPGHPEYGHIDMLTSTVSVYRDGVLVFHARPVYKKRKFRGLVEYKCEELISQLNDYQMEPYHWNNDPEHVIDLVLTKYNQRAPLNQKIQKGTVKVTTVREYEVKSYAGCWDALTYAFSENEGCYLVPRYEQNGIYLDYLREQDLAMSDQTIEFGKNMVDLFLETDSTEAFSVLLPLGKVVQSGVYDPEDEQGDKPTIQYTKISSVNSGSDYLVSSAGMELFGRREHTQYFNDLDNPSDLKAAAQTYLNENAVKFSESVELTAADLHNMDVNVPAFRFLARVNCLSPLLGLSHVYPIEKLEIPIGDPEDADISLGKPLVPLSERIAEYERSNQDFYNEYRFIVEGSGLVINKNGVWAFSEDIDNGLGAFFYVTKNKITASLEDLANSLRAYIELTASNLLAMFEDGLNSLRSYVELTASHLRTEFYDDMASLRSYVEITASHLRTEFYDDVNSLRSYVEITASHLRTEFYDDLNSLRSYVEITASHLRTEFYDDMSSLRSYVEITASHLRTEFYDDMSSLRSYVEITASHLQTEFYDDLNSLRSYVELTASHLEVEFYDDINSLRSYVELTASHLQTEFIDDLNSLRSYVELTASHLEVEFSDEINSLRSYVDLTASNLRIEFEDEAASMRSAIEQNAYAISLKVSQGDVATQLAVEVGNVTITGGNLIVDGMITSTSLATAIASLGEVDVDGILYCTGVATFGEDVTFQDSVIGPGAQFTTLYFGQGGANDAGDAVSGFGTPTESGGQISIPYNTFNQTGAGTINFNIAATQTYIDGVAAAAAGVTLSGSWTGNLVSGKSYSVTASNGATNTSPAVSYVFAYGNPTWAADNKSFTQMLAVQDENGVDLYGDTETFDTTTSYNAGESSVTVTGASGWSSGANTLTLSNGSTYTTYMPAPNSATWSSYQQGNNYLVYCVVGGREYSHTFTL